MEIDKEVALNQQWKWDDDAEDAFGAWFHSMSSPFTFMSEYFYGDCKIEDEKTREDMMYKWLHLAFVTGYMYGKPAGAGDDFKNNQLQSKTNSQVTHLNPPADLIEDWIVLAKRRPQSSPDPNKLAALAAEWGYRQGSDAELEE